MVWSPEEAKKKMTFEIDTKQLQTHMTNAGKKNINDPRNTLFREFLRTTKLIEPDYIIGENVKISQDMKDKTEIIEDEKENN